MDIKLIYVQTKFLRIPLLIAHYTKSMYGHLKLWLPLNTILTTILDPKKADGGGLWIYV